MRSLMVSFISLAAAIHPAHAYSLLWLDVTAANAYASAAAHTNGEFGQDPEHDYDFESLSFPGDELPLQAEASARARVVSGDASSTVHSNRIFLDAHGFDGYSGFADTWAGASMSRRFRVIGGSGLVDVGIALSLNAYGGYLTDGSWMAGVEGVSTIGNEYHYQFDEWDQDRQWVGSLEYGRDYVFSLEGTVGSSSDFAQVSLSLVDVPEAAPVPEPGTWFLLGIGSLVACVSSGTFRRRGRRDS